MEKESKLKEILNNFEVYLCDVLLMVAIVVATLNVIMRYVFANPLMWSEEICRFSFVWVSFLSMGYAITHGGHLFVDVLTVFENKIPGFLKGLRFVINVIWLCFSVYFAYQGYIMMAASTQASPALSIPMGIVYAAIPVGSIIMGVRLVQQSYRDFFQKKKEEPQVAEGKEE